MSECRVEEAEDLVSARPSVLVWRIGSGVILVRPFVNSGLTDWATESWCVEFRLNVDRVVNC